MYLHHPALYDRTVVANKWPYKLTSQLNNVSSKKNAGNARDQALPGFSPEAFIEYLVRFIVADDQVSPNNLVFFLALTPL